MQHVPGGRGGSLARAPAQTRPCQPSRRHRASLPASRGASRSARGISSSPGLTSSYPRRAAVCTRGERGRPMREAACALAPGTVTRSAARGDTLQPACTRRWRIAALGGRRYGKAPLPWRAPGGSGRRGQAVRIDRRPRELARVRVLCFSSRRDLTCARSRRWLGWIVCSCVCVQIRTRVRAPTVPLGYGSISRR